MSTVLSAIRNSIPCLRSTAGNLHEAEASGATTKSSWKGHVVQGESTTNPSKNSCATICIVSYFVLSGVLIIVGLGLTVTGILTSVSMVEIIGEVLIVACFCADFFVFFSCATVNLIQ